MGLIVTWLAVAAFMVPSASRILPVRQEQLPTKYRVADVRTPYIGGNKIDGEHPAGYEDFLALWVDIKSPKGYQGDYRELLLPNKDGMISVSGRLVFKGNSSGYESYEFKTATLIEKHDKLIQLIFATETLKGVNYVFNGRYIEAAAQKSDVHLEGVMKKYKNGREISETKLKFMPFAILE